MELPAVRPATCCEGASAPKEASLMPRLSLAIAVCLSMVPRLLLAAEGTVVGTVSS